MPNPKLFIILNALSFQLVWWSGVLAANQLIFLSMLLIVGHFLLSQTPRQDFNLMCLCGLIGISIDSVLTWVGVFSFSDTPYWLALLWLQFGLSLRYSLVFFQRIALVWQALLGGIFGGLSYIAGADFDAVTLPFGLFNSGLILLVIWCVLFPVLLSLSRGTHGAKIVLEKR